MSKPQRNLPRSKHLRQGFGGRRKRSVANGGLKSVSALLKKLSGPLIVLRLQAQTNKK